MKFKFSSIVVIAIAVMLIFIPDVTWSAMERQENCLICLASTDYLFELDSHCPTFYGTEYFTRGFWLEGATCMSPICSYYWKVLCSKEVSMPVSGGFFIDKYDYIYTGSYCFDCGDV